MQIRSIPHPVRFDFALISSLFTLFPTVRPPACSFLHILFRIHLLQRFPSCALRSSDSDVASRAWRTCLCDYDKCMRSVFITLSALLSATGCFVGRVRWLGLGWTFAVRPFRICPVPHSVAPGSPCFLVASMRDAHSAFITSTGSVGEVVDATFGLIHVSTSFRFVSFHLGLQSVSNRHPCI